MIGALRAWAGTDVLTRDGTVARIRPLVEADYPALRRLHEELGHDSLRFRFFAVSRHTAELYVDHLQRRDPDTLCLVATVEDRLVAVATAEPVSEEEREVAFLVADDQHGRGLGSLLLEHLADEAREGGTCRFVADVLGDNRAMRQVFREAGFAVTQQTEQGVTRVVVDLHAGSRVLDSADAREEEAQRHSLRALLHPESVAVLGVRRDGTGVGAAVLRALRSGGYAGRVDVVHPQGGRVCDTAAVRSCRDLSGPLDLAVVAVPADQVLGAVRDAADGGAGAAVVLTSGFGELGDEGRLLQRELASLARARNLRLVGPNCLGVMSTADGQILNATFSSRLPVPGRLAVATQSGGVGIVLLDAARAAGLGIASFVSLGNKADVSGNDLLAAWHQDPGVGAVALYLESFGNAHKFARLARSFCRDKPVLAVLGGRSEGGRRAGASHTAAAASGAVALDALMRHTGVIACQSATDLVATALVLERQPLPAGRRLGIVTNAGGMGVLGADRAAEVGLVVPTLSPEVGARLTATLSASAGWSNPVDTGAGATAGQLADAVRVVARSGEVDSLLVVVVATTLLDVDDVLTALAATAVGDPTLPVVLVLLGTDPADPARVPGLAVLDSAELGVLALARAAGRRAWLDSARGEPPAEDLPRRRRARRLADEALTAALTAAPADAPADACWLSHAQTADLVAAYAVDLVGETARGTQATVEAARRQGFPVVVKVTGADGRHKSDEGLVQVGVPDATHVRALVVDWHRRFGGAIEVLVQPQGQGVEIAVGLVRDPVVGPMLMLAAGGTDIDVWDDRQFLLAPASAIEVEQALRRLKVWPRLTGHRGSAPTDVDALVRLVVSVGMLGHEVPQVAELDLNPVLVSPEGVAVVDSRLRLAEVPAYRDAPGLS